jgi:protein-S-isoprenylcysteine O-methyltransferase Ste14
MAERDGPGVRVPPPLIFIGTLVLGVVLDRFVFGSTTFVSGSARYVTGGLLAALGVLGIALALRLFRRAGTRPEPWLPSSAIVETGVYRYTRNPMYLGMALLYTGLALILDSTASLMLLVPLLIIIRYGVIGREEVYLERTFGEPYRQYRNRVRRWL